MSNPVVESLVARSNRLGADPRTTNYAGGNTSAKGTTVDPVTGTDVEVLWVKGSGGDLGTLTEKELAVLRLDRVRALADVYPGVEREDEMVAAFDYCLHGHGGAAPSIDTAMHALVDSAHVDHLHPDAGIALATAADGEALTREVFGDAVVWVPWRRPGFQLGLDIAAIKEANPQAIGCILGGHGITAWGDTSQEAEERSLRIIGTAEAFIASRSGDQHPFGAVVHPALPEDRARARAAALAPVIRGLASMDRPQVGHFTDSDVVLDFVGPRRPCPGWPRSARPARTTSCAPRSRRWWSTCPATHPCRTSSRGSSRAARAVPQRLPGLLRPARHTRTARRSAARTRRSCWSPGSGCSRSARTSRPPGSPGSSTSTRST